MADFLLPSNGPGFDEGTTTSVGGRVQLRTRGLHTETPQDVRILTRVLKALEADANYKDATDVLKEIAEKIPAYSGITRKAIRKTGQNRGTIHAAGGSAVEPQNAGTNGEGLTLRVTDVLFRHDKVLDAESPLAHQFQQSTVQMHPDDAEALGLKDGARVRVTANGAFVEARVAVSGKCNPGSVVMPRVSDEQNLNHLLTPGALARVTITPQG